MTRKKLARLAGVLYLGMGTPAAFNLQYFPSRFIVQGDAAATAARITSAPLLYRLWVISDLVSGVLYVCLALTFYQLFKDVDRGQARLLVAFVVLQVAMGFALLLTQLAPLVLLNGASYWSAFEKPQLDALALGFLGLRSQGIGAISAYWGLWLLPLGVLVSRSRFIPQLLGVFLILAGVAYLVSTVTFFIVPAYYRIVFLLGVPLFGLGEIGLMGWLLIKGARDDNVTDGLR